MFMACFLSESESPPLENMPILLHAKSCMLYQRVNALAILTHTNMHKYTHGSQSRTSSRVCEHMGMHQCECGILHVTMIQTALVRMWKCAARLVRR